ncbi:MAG: hypothetical protein DWQ01_11065 [Planctomycetota bacterium]|nr:MAG: hypothetical protein DWQ01_11065 [Planctomycetota bacterium]
MKTLALIVREMLLRKAAAALMILAVCLPVALGTFFAMASRAMEDETRIIQRDMGLNVLILSDKQDLAEYWQKGYAQETLPISHLHKLADQSVANRLIPMLQEAKDWRGMSVLLTGIAPEIFKGGQKKKAVFGRQIASGNLILGAEVAEHLGLSEGDSVPWLEQEFQIESVLHWTGTREDIRVYANLEQVQQILDMPDRINEIQALECRCEAGDQDPLLILRQELTPLLPGTQIIRRNRLAEARRQQRLMAARFHQMAGPVLFLLAGLCISAFAAANARDRNEEIGVLHALGFTGGRIANLFLGRAALLALFGAALGFVLGTGTGFAMAPSLFPISAASLQWQPTWFWQALVLAPSFAALASLAPVLFAVNQDPLDVLRES